MPPPTTTTPHAPGSSGLRALVGKAYRRVRHATPEPLVDAWNRADYWRRRFRSRHPASFNEKLAYKMLRDRRPLLTTFADKVAVREYVAARVGADVLPELLAVTERASDLQRGSLPEQFALKAAHASGGVVLVTDEAPDDARLPDPDTYWPRVAIRPEDLDWGALVRVADAWIGRDYGGGRWREWAYLDVPHRIIVEELLHDAGGGLPADIKLFVFNGRCRLVQVDTNRYGEHRQNFFRPDWTALPARLAAPPADEAPAQPACLERMLEIAEVLGADTDLVRVDLYDIAGRTVFGELTSYVLGGRFTFQPPEFDAEVGSWWSVPERYT